MRRPGKDNTTGRSPLAQGATKISLRLGASVPSRRFTVRWGNGPETSRHGDLNSAAIDCNFGAIETCATSGEDRSLGEKLGAVALAICLGGGLGAAAHAASSLDRQLAKLGPEERAHQ